jgi:hypothetical protein
VVKSICDVADMSCSGVTVTVTTFRLVVPRAVEDDVAAGGRSGVTVTVTVTS